MNSFPECKSACKSGKDSMTRTASARVVFRNTDCAIVAESLLQGRALYQDRTAFAAGWHPGKTYQRFPLWRYASALVGLVPGAGALASNLLFRASISWKALCLSFGSRSESVAQ
jgi:hypothetical protein